KTTTAATAERRRPAGRAGYRHRGGGELGPGGGLRVVPVQPVLFGQSQAGGQGPVPPALTRPVGQVVILVIAHHGGADLDQPVEPDPLVGGQSADPIRSGPSTEDSGQGDGGFDRL